MPKKIIGVPKTQQNKKPRTKKALGQIKGVKKNIIIDNSKTNNQIHGKYQEDDDEYDYLDEDEDDDDDPHINYPPSIDDGSPN